jgi:hypothetical protein
MPKLHCGWFRRLANRPAWLTSPSWDAVIAAGHTCAGGVDGRALGPRAHKTSRAAAAARVCACGGRHRPTHAVRGPGETAPTKRGEGLLCHPRVWRTSSAYTRKYVDQVRLSCARRGPTRAAAASTLRECSHRSALAPIKRAEEPGPSGRNPLNSAFPAPPPADSGLTRKHTHTRAWGTPRADPSAQGGAGGAAEPLHHVPAGRCGAPPRGRHQLARLRREQPHPLSGTWRSGGAHPQLEQLHHVDESTPTAPHCL